ncbi:MAG: pitrilysin family protein [Chloracidobacterium sp.]|uniref:Insulinase family protein n=1 Tax=Chloracidobacterium validum TaxID=2821543 RepID=A0ABX8BDE5_9BACT|nr:pitrilysin family protein [Chloracidobacterium validum]QUW03880.1 insulinase family protein [Chloracidobacterium validum]
MKKSIPSRSPLEFTRNPAPTIRPRRRGPSRMVLPSGLTLIVEPMAHVRSVALSVWGRISTRHEAANLNGISHFVEHMLFKGTDRRDTRQIAMESDRLGGQIEAATMMESVNYQIQTIDTCLQPALDLLTDLLLAPRFDEVEFIRERAVILEEMKTIADSPEEFIFELFLANFFPGHALGRPIEGTPRTLRRMTPDRLRQFHQLAYRPDQLVLSVAGRVDTDLILDHCQSAINPRSSVQPPVNQPFDSPVGAPTFCLNHAADFEQAHLLLGLPAPAIQSPERTASTLLATLLGGGLSSRLFLRIREEAGLAYHIYADATAYRDAGVFLIYAAVAPHNLKRTVKAIIRELADVAQGNLTDDEVELAKAQHLMSLHLGHDASSVRANQNGYQEIFFGQIVSKKNLEQEINSVTRLELHALAHDLFAGQTCSGIALGNLGRYGLQPDWLHIPRHVSRSTVQVIS